ncbi:nucleotidyltransferase family protein [Colwellia sp. E2M01]|uniref:nucleotidyltransferase family protein n=1 Tax=Colwellia sp. E2M01 TaxID=2841561 RepID=UPI001C081CF6|nr:nucleotidyltransferase family protein [Colwellia sp. E2M01]MBU2869726.1 nucleotidyltransferase family protein [Colwellia sp. E2M01]
MLLANDIDSINIKIVILAGGNSVRFNGIKQLSLVHRDNSPILLLQQSINTVTRALTIEEIPTDHLYVATGESHRQIAEQISQPLHYCDQAYQGMGYTIAQSVAMILKNDPLTTHILFTLGDQVALEINDYLTLLQKVEEFPAHMICAETADGISAPAIFPHHYFTKLQTLSGDKGAKAVLQTNQQQLIKIPMLNASFDIDTQEDLLRWNNL